MHLYLLQQNIHKLKKLNTGRSTEAQKYFLQRSIQTVIILHNKDYKYIGDCFIVTCF